MIITNLTTSDIAEINFKKCDENNQFEGRGLIKNKDGETIL